MPAATLMAASALMVIPGAAADAGTFASYRPMSIGWFDNRADFLGCEQDGGIGLNFSALTSITVNGCGMNENNTVDCDKLNATTLRGLKAAAQARGTKVMIGVDFTSKACRVTHRPDECPILAPGVAQATYVSSLVDFVRANRLDGVEVDYEEFGVGSQNDLAARKLFSALLVKIKHALASSSAAHASAHGAELGVCLAANFNNPFVFVDPKVGGVLGAIDYYNVMSYVWSPSGNFQRAKNAVAAVKSAGFPKDKINMGIAFYDQGSEDYCDLVRSCTNASCTHECTSPSSNMCNGKLVDGQDMQTAMGSWVSQEGWGGVLIFQVNYDHDNLLLNALGAGLAAGSALKERRAKIYSDHLR